MQPAESSERQEGPPKEAPDLDQQLQRDKLRAEIRNLKRRWPLFAPYLTTVVVAVGAWITYQNSEFKRDAEKAKADLAVATDRLTRIRDQIAKASRERDAAVGQRDAARAELRANVKDWKEGLAKIGTQAQNVANSTLTGVSNDPIIQHSRMNRLRNELQKIADAMDAVVDGRPSTTLRGPATQPH